MSRADWDSQRQRGSPCSDEFDGPPLRNAAPGRRHWYLGARRTTYDRTAVNIFCGFLAVTYTYVYNGGVSERTVRRPVVMRVCVFSGRVRVLRRLRRWRVVMFRSPAQRAVARGNRQDGLPIQDVCSFMTATGTTWWCACDCELVGHSDDSH